MFKIAADISSLYVRGFSTVLAVVFAIILATTSSAQAQHGEGGGRSSGGGGAAVGIGIGIGIGIIASEAAKAAKKKKAAKPAPKRTKKVRRKPSKKRKKQAKKPMAVPDFLPGEILLTFAPGTADTQVNQFLGDYGLQQISSTTIALLNLRIVRARFPSNITPGRAMQISNDPRVVAQPNYLYVPAADTAPDYAFLKLGVRRAHLTTLGQGVVVAVIDSGVDSNHPALNGAVLEEFAAVDDKSKSSDAHGTAIASIIAARDGMTSVAPGAQILSIKAFARDPKFSRTLANSFDILKGIDYAVAKNARILNLSFAGPRDPLMAQALAVAASRGVVIVAAAGNKGSNAPPAYPGAYRDVIAATATDAKDKLYKNANRGDYIAIAAPGVDVLAAGSKNGYSLNSGTSMAAAYVTGSIALMLQNSPQLNASTAIARLAASAKDLGDSGKDAQFGHGLIDIGKAVQGN